MRDGSGRVVGIRRRRVSDGMKLTIKGGHEGLFVAMPLADDQILYVVEGASDTAAAIAALGHSSVIGRPSCNSGNQHLMQWVRLHKDKAIVVVPDEGEPGVNGARRCAELLSLEHANVRLSPPPPAKDLRAFVRQRGLKVATEWLVRASVESRPIRLKFTFRGKA